MGSHAWSFFFASACAATPLSGAELLPVPARDFLQQPCADCHTGDAAEAGIILDNSQPIEWQDSKSAVFWERVYNAIRRSEMPCHAK